MTKTISKSKTTEETIEIVIQGKWLAVKEMIWPKQNPPERETSAADAQRTFEKCTLKWDNSQANYAVTLANWQLLNNLTVKADGETVVDSSKLNQKYSYLNLKKADYLFEFTANFKLGADQLWINQEVPDQIIPAELLTRTKELLTRACSGIEGQAYCINREFLESLPQEVFHDNLIIKVTEV